MRLLLVHVKFGKQLTYAVICLWIRMVKKDKNAVISVLKSTLALINIADSVEKLK